MQSNLRLSFHPKHEIHSYPPYFPSEKRPDNTNQSSYLTSLINKFHTETDGKNNPIILNLYESIKKWHPSVPESVTVLKSPCLSVRHPSRTSIQLNSGSFENCQHSFNFTEISPISQATNPTQQSVVHSPSACSAAAAAACALTPHDTQTHQPQSSSDYSVERMTTTPLDGWNQLSFPSSGLYVFDRLSQIHAPFGWIPP